MPFTETIQATGWYLLTCCAPTKVVQVEGVCSIWECIKPTYVAGLPSYSYDCCVIRNRVRAIHLYYFMCGSICKCYGLAQTLASQVEVAVEVRWRDEGDEGDEAAEAKTFHFTNRLASLGHI